MNSFTAIDRDAGKRLDHYLLEKLPQYSRSRLQSWIKDARVLVRGAAAKPSLILRGGEHIEVSPADLPPLTAEPEDLPIEILYEDSSVIAINKPAELVVHAGAGNRSGTLVNRLVHHFQTLSQVGGDLRPGIVHRLDKGTSGVMLVARDDAAHRALAAQFSSRSVEKIYLALVHGRMRAEEGRTHQIRVHLSSIGHPVAGDRLYGARPAERVFLHAHRISFMSPSTNGRVTVEAPLAPNLAQWLASLTV